MSGTWHVATGVSAAKEDVRTRRSPQRFDGAERGLLIKLYPKAFCKVVA